MAQPKVTPVTTEVFMSSRQVREMFNGIGRMTIYRWMHAEVHPFPLPAIYNGKRRYWRLSDIERWCSLREAARDHDAADMRAFCRQGVGKAA